MKITELPEMKAGDPPHVTAMMDGKVHLRIHPIDFVMAPDAALHMAKMLQVSAKVARAIQEETAHLPADVVGEPEKVRGYLMTRLKGMDL
jgi:hypothetical protein